MKKLIIIPFLFICNFGITQNNVISQIIGIPILIDKILVAQNDFLFKMNCEDAKYECKKLGKVWKLPTKKELNITPVYLMLLLQIIFYLMVLTARTKCGFITVPNFPFSKLKPTSLP